MRINHNMSAIKANTNLSKTNTLLDKSLERLSSGYKINRAADNAAGLAITQKMRTQIAGLEQSSTNASDGISVIQTAEGALNEVESMLQRIRELSVQAANGTNTTSDRTALQDEINQLNEEIARISETTEFNTKTLLDGNVDNKSYSSNVAVDLISISDSVDVASYDLTITQDGRQAVLVGETNVGEHEFTAEEAGSIIVNGISIAISAGDSMETAYEKIRNVCDSVNVKAFLSDGTYSDELASTDSAGYTEATVAEGGVLTFATYGYGSNHTLEVYCGNENLRDIFGISEDGAKAQGIDAKAELSDTFAKTATVSASGNIITVTDVNQFEMQFEIKAGSANTAFSDATLMGDAAEADPTSDEYDVTITVLDAGPVDLQVGANEGQLMTVRIPRVDPKTLGIDDINVCTDDGAQMAITACDNAIAEVSAIRAKLGAYQNRLDHAISNLDLSGENITEAMSRIEDTDMAEEMTNYTQSSVLSQAGTSMLAQANQRPQNILTLLQG